MKDYVVLENSLEGFQGYVVWKIMRLGREISESDPIDPVGIAHLQFNSSLILFDPSGV